MSLGLHFCVDSHTVLYHFHNINMKSAFSLLRQSTLLKGTLLYIAGIQCIVLLLFLLYYPHACLTVSWHYIHMIL